ncbi:aconitase X swivel domain-containing protein [Terrarubrum flagellatum]|uniref:aconitase X swivel domain-containing protein n=1 Tax=Terrirubrum flagellatum TaxID=2895980 RepID=UPI0031455CBC
MAVSLEPLVSGAAQARVLTLSAPISFWGGVDPKTGDVIDARHPDRGANISGLILGLPGTIGSSSASSVLLELVRVGKAPAAILIAEPDAILLLGLIVAREMGWATPPAFKCPAPLLREWQGQEMSIAETGAITLL